MKNPWMLWALGLTAAGVLLGIAVSGSATQPAAGNFTCLGTLLTPGAMSPITLQITNGNVAHYCTPVGAKLVSASLLQGSTTSISVSAVAGTVGQSATSQDTAPGQVVIAAPTTSTSGVASVNVVWTDAQGVPQVTVIPVTVVR